MKSILVHGLGTLAFALLSTAVQGQTPAGTTRLSERERYIATFKHASDSELKAQYLGCDHDSRQRLLDFEEAARCSVTGDLLKARSFQGDFNALLAWWRDHRDDPDNR